MPPPPDVAPTQHLVNTAMGLALSGAYPGVVRLLLAAGADPNLLSQVGSWLAPCRCCVAGSLQPARASTKPVT